MSNILPSLLPFSLLDLPRAIFMTPGSGFRDRLLARRVSAGGRTAEYLTERDLQEIAYRPEMLADLLRQNLLPAHSRSQMINQEHALTFRAMVQSYDELAPELEKFVLQDPESIERLIVYLRYKDRPGLNAEGHYRALLDSDPNRAIRVAKDDEDAAFKAELFASQAETNRALSPAWAFFYLRVTPSLTELPADVISALKKSDEYAYLGARLCKSLKFHSSEWGVLASDVTSPRWVFHFLRDGLAPDTATMIDRLLLSPPWLVQYIEDVKCSPAERSQLFLDCQMKNIDEKRYAFLDDLELWFRSKSINDLSAMLAA